MIIWSRLDLENWADAILKDFLKESFEAFAPIDIDRLTTEYLGLKIQYETLSDELDIYGISAFRDTNIELKRNGRIENVKVKANTVLIETALCSTALKGTRRFTVGHEAAHQILRRYEYQTVSMKDASQKIAFFKKQSTESSEIDWSEWQANTLGAALIMPQRLIEECMFRFGDKSSITVYGKNQLNFDDSFLISNIKDFLGVSKTALLKRLEQLGYIEHKSIEEYYEIRTTERMKWLLWQERKAHLRPRKKI